MRMTQLFTHTLREVASEAGSPGYQLLLRAGYLRPLAPASFGWLPAGAQTRQRLAHLIAQALMTCGGQALALPQLQPAESIGETPGQERVWLVRDRNQRALAMGAGHAAAVLELARGVLQSYRQLPQLLYHAWQPCLEEVRAGGGLLGNREPAVVDAYGLYADAADAAAGYARLQAALAGVCAACQVPTLSATTRLDEDGAPLAHGLFWLNPLGDQTLVHCPSCGYAALQAVARAAKVPPPPETPQARQEIATPECKTIADLAAFLNIPRARTAKAMFMVAYIEGEGDRPLIAMLRGDCDLNEDKLKRALHARTVGPATEAEIRAMGAEPGYGSPLGLSQVYVVADDLLAASPNLVVGANRPGYHTLNVTCGHDYQADLVTDLTLARAGDGCPECGGALQADPAVELASLVQAGDQLSRAVGASYLDRAGQPCPFHMGVYRFYSDRLLAAAAEIHRDERGLAWPAALAPYQVYLMTVGKRNEAIEAVAERLYAELSAAGLATLYDDRDERAGVKFNDADLLGMPLRVALGERGLKDNLVEIKPRRAEQVELIPLPEVVAYAQAHLASARTVG